MALARDRYPLFYALSQTGRAIAAAHAEGVWRLRMHGLSAPELDRPPLDIEVKRTPAAAKDGLSVDSVTGVAAATHGDVFTDAATIGALWSSLPELFNLLPASSDTGPNPLRLVPENPGPENLHLQTDPGHIYATVVGFSGTADELASYLTNTTRPATTHSYVSRRASHTSDSTPYAGTDSCFGGTRMPRLSTATSLPSTVSRPQRVRAFRPRPAG